MSDDRPFQVRERTVNLLLLLCSFAVYAFYFGDVFMKMNGVLSSITGDALKNYYTFAFHITRDPGLLHFEGMHYPYGEHVVFTDCQPLLTFVFRLLPFTHQYLVGILHWLMFGSFIISPLIINRILRNYGVDQVSAFLSALAITLLSPQFAKIHGGHHGLAYGCVIPLSMLLTQQVIQTGKRNVIIRLAAHNTLLYLIHPYLGFGVSLFTFLTGVSDMSLKRAFNIKKVSTWLLTGIAPILFFKVFMLVTDHHSDRTTEPYGYEALVENPSTLLSPDFGPFRGVTEAILPAKVIHFEGHSYLGFFVILASIAALVLSIVKFRQLSWRTLPVPFLVASSILLFISFGYHNTIMNVLHVKIAALNQFRAVCRFAWFFYYAMPIFIIPLIHQVLEGAHRTRTLRLIASAFLALNLLEAHHYFTYDKPAFWKNRNILNAEYLTQEERSLITRINTANVQAIMPLPLFYLGSEMYDRAGGDNSMIPSLFLSYHTGLPVIGCWMSRTSMTETAHVIELLNTYKRNRPVLDQIDAKNILVLRCKDPLLPDEERMYRKCALFYQNDSMALSILSSGALRSFDAAGQHLVTSSSAVRNNCVFIRDSVSSPFIPTDNKDYKVIFVLDSNLVTPGRYAVSMHYHYKDMNYRALAANLIITEGKNGDYGWKYNNGFSMLSGPYKGFGVYENYLEIRKGGRYEFVTKGNADIQYRISRFLLRPDTMNTLEVTAEGDTLLNNFPRGDSLRSPAP
jgi:hypothetical protein